MGWQREVVHGEHRVEMIAAGERSVRVRGQHLVGDLGVTAPPQATAASH